MNGEKSSGVVLLYKKDPGPCTGIPGAYIGIGVIHSIAFMPVTRVIIALPSMNLDSRAIAFAALLHCSIAGATSPAAFAFLRLQPVMITCMAQGGTYSVPIWNRIIRPSPAESETRKAESEAAFEEMLVKSAWAVCVRNRRWISDEICMAISEALAQPEQDLRPFIESYRSELSKLGHVYKYFESSYFSRAGDPACPAS